MMMLLSLHGLPPAQIAVLPDCHPATVRRLISWFNGEGLADRRRSGRPRLGGQQLTGRIAAPLARLGAMDTAPDPAVPGLAAGQPAAAVPAGPAGSCLVEAKLTARGDPDHDQVVAEIVARPLELPGRSVVLAEDETHLNLLPHVRVTWTR
jgi:hypothetical protein